MGSRAHRFSIFSQSLDRIAFLAYFLGAVVPFVALAFVVQRFALPELTEGLASEGLMALTVSVGALSAAAFFALRRVTWQTVAAIERDKRRLEALLETSGRLASAPHAEAVAEAAVGCALELADSPAAFLVTGGGVGAPPKLEASAGADSLFASIERDLPDLLEQSSDEQRAALWTPTSPSGTSSAPWMVVPVGRAGTLLAATGPGDERLDQSGLDSLSTLAGLAAVALRNARLGDAQRNFFVHVTDILVAALDSHMDVQAGHSRRVAHLANLIGRELGLEDDVRQRLHFASLLHDVGMLRIDYRRGTKALYRQHASLGHRMLAPIQFWSDIAPIVLHHHEWWDGNGYPEGLARDAIPLESRIIGLAEAFDSMTSDSSYKAPVEFDEALRRVDEGSGTQFDPEIAAIFLDLAGRGEVELR